MKIIICTIYSCLLSFLLHGQNVSVSVSGKTYYGIAGIHYGVDFAIVSMETDKMYFSKILSPFKQRHSIIENLPPGKYRILMFSDPLFVQTPDNPIHEYFGYFKFEAGKSYYLGSFIGRIKVGKGKPLIYTIEDDEIPKKLLNSLIRRKLIDKDEEPIKTYPYNSDSLIIK